MNGEWFRFYAEFIHDPKMKRFSIEEWGIWNGLLCLACESPIFGSLYIGKNIKYELDDIILAFNNKLEKSQLKTTLDKMQELGMIEYDSNKAIVIKNFRERQSSEHPRMINERVKKHRNKDSNDPVTDMQQESNDIDKIRLDKIRLDKNILLSKDNNSDPVNKFISMFKTINPSYKRLYSNKTERASLERMIKEHSVEKVEKFINGALGVYGRPFAPRITTPYMLEKKLGDLIAFIGGEIQKPKTMVEI